MTPNRHAGAQVSEDSGAIGEHHGQQHPQYNRRRRDLDGLLDEEHEALAIWTRLVSRGHRTPLSPQLKRIAMAAWKAYGALSRERNETERWWGR